MLKKILLVYVIAALIVSVATTLMQVQPALFFIELLTGSDNKFPVSATILLTMLALLLPALIVALIPRLFNTKQRNLVPDLTGKTGILVRRERALSNAVYTDAVMVNGEKKSAVSNGKSTFAELPSGSYKVFIKGATTGSPVMDITLAAGQVLKLKTGYAIDGLKTKQYLETDD
ncbi:MAG: hypothetical protein HYZ14_16515 [Bacteroidetes bacterium]|nr:hypothetical protein [Bacteroidota bacterium]